MSSNVTVDVKNGVCWITLNRAKKYNSITGEMYRALCTAFDDADENDDVIITVLTGTGVYYTAGSDFTPAEMSSEAELVDLTSAILFRHAEGRLDHYGPYKLWVDRMIRHKKPMVALVNGPAVGIGVTTLALCDAVFASDKSTFWCPFTEIGLNPEAASSITFVQSMGYSKAARLALFAEKMTAEEAYVAGLVTKVIPHEKFQEQTREIIKRYTGLGKQSMLVSKRLLRPQPVIEQLLTANRQEYEIDYFENSSLLHLGNDREEVSLPMDALQAIFGPASKLQAFAVNNSEVIVLMVDKVYNDVTPHENLMQCIATVLSEMCDMETGKIAEIARIRLPLVISGGFTMAARHEEEAIRIDLYNEDLIHTGSIEGLRLQF